MTESDKAVRIEIIRNHLLTRTGQTADAREMLRDADSETVESYYALHCKAFHLFGRRLCELIK